LENREELIAYLQMKNLLVAMFNKGEVKQAKAKIELISEMWTERHKV
jgi:hypothetical protein